MTGTLFAQYEKMGGVYYAYPVTETELAAAPEGYQPFYISHYGRHGSRWMTSDQRYEWICRQFDDTKNLTKLGKDVRRRMAKVWKNAKGNGGKLSPLGARQHRGIARRMYQNFPQLFTADVRLSAYRALFNAAVDAAELSAIRAHLQQQRALGSREFQSTIEHKLGRCTALRPAHRPPRKGGDVDPEKAL
jgi:hypothetical protein